MIKKRSLNNNNNNVSEQLEDLAHEEFNNDAQADSNLEIESAQNNNNNNPPLESSSKRIVTEFVTEDPFMSSTTTTTTTETTLSSTSTSKSTTTSSTIMTTTTECSTTTLSTQKSVNNKNLTFQSEEEDSEKTIYESFYELLDNGRHAKQNSTLDRSELISKLNDDEFEIEKL